MLKNQAEHILGNFFEKFKKTLDFFVKFCYTTMAVKIRTHIY